MVKFLCHGCGKKLGARDEMAGKRVKCPGCGRPVPVPATSALPPPPQPGVARKTDYDLSAVPDAVPIDPPAAHAPATQEARVPVAAPNGQKSTACYFAPVTVILSLTCCFPLGLILMWAGNLWTQTTRIVVTAMFALLAIVGSISEHSRPPASKQGASAVDGEKSSSSGEVSPPSGGGGGTATVHDWTAARPPEEWEAMTVGKTYVVFGRVEGTTDGWNLFTRKASSFRFAFADSEAASALVAGELSKRSSKRACVLISARYAGTKDLRTADAFLSHDPKDRKESHVFEGVQFKGLAFDDYDEMFEGKPVRGTKYIVQGNYEGSVDGYELVRVSTQRKIAFNLPAPLEQASGSTVTIIGEFDGFKDFKTVLGAPLRVPYLNNAEPLE